MSDLDPAKHKTKAKFGTTGEWTLNTFSTRCSLATFVDQKPLAASLLAPAWVSRMWHPREFSRPVGEPKKKKKKKKYPRTKVQVSTVPGQCSGIKEIRRFLLYFFFLSLGCPHAWIVCFAALLSLIQRHLQRCNNVTVPFGHSRFSLFFVSLCFATSPRSAL